MSEAPSRKQDQFIVRLPDGMRDQIKALAAANGRSMNAEIVQALEAHLARVRVGQAFRAAPKVGDAWVASGMAEDAPGRAELLERIGELIDAYCAGQGGE